jgi:methionyl-tRNA formyltransferase
MPSPGRIVFAGSPEFALPALAVVADSLHDLCAVLTQPDRPAGRGRALQMSPVKRYALERGIPVMQPESLRRDAQAVAQLRALAPDLLVVVAYGLILPPAVLDLPARGCVNLHASLLPRWRGAAPIQAALLAGDERTGVSLMRLEEGLDTGPVAAARAVTIGARETAGELHDRLAALGAELLASELAGLLDGSAVFVPQPTVGVTYAPKFGKSDARLDWHEPAAALARRIRAYNPWPVAETRLDGRQLRCWDATVLPADAHAAAEPGRVLAAGPAGIDVQTGAGILRLLAVQLAGRQRLDAGTFANGQQLPGKVLGA